MSESNKPKQNRISTVIGGVSMVIMFIALIMVTVGVSNEMHSRDRAEYKNMKENEEREYSEIKSKLKDIGIIGVKKINKNDNSRIYGIWTDYDTSYRVELTGDKIISRVFIPLDSLFCNYLLVYSKENGRAVDSKLDGNYAEIELNVENYSEQWIEENLKSPSTAEFGNRSVRTDGEYFEIKGYVDSQNGLGATLRSTYTVQSKIEISSSSNGEKNVNYIPTYINIDDKFIKGEQVNIEENLIN